MPDSKFPIVDDCSTTEIYAGGGQFFSMIRDTDVILTFMTPRWHPSDGSATNHVVARLAMPISRAQELGRGLLNFLEQKGHPSSEGVGTVVAANTNSEDQANVAPASLIRDAS